MPSTPARRKYQSSIVCLGRAGTTSRWMPVSRNARANAVGQVRIDFVGRRPSGRVRPIVQGIQTLDGDTAGGGGGIGRHGGRIVRQRLAHRGTPVVEAPERQEQQIEGRGPDDRSHGDEERRAQDGLPFCANHDRPERAMPRSQQRSARRGARTARGSTSTSGGAESTAYTWPEYQRSTVVDGNGASAAPTARTTTPARHHVRLPICIFRRLFVQSSKIRRSLPPGITMPRL